MQVIHANNVNGAWPKALLLMKGQPKTESRNGSVTVCDYPVTTVYAKPVERVIFDPVRDANPIFHLHEALWMLAGRDDATWLDQFIGDFSKRFAEEGGVMHGAYGKRWRDWFDMDQLDVVVHLLKQNNFDRQALIQMWDVNNDLGVVGLKDRPCNQQVLLRADRGVLDITVTCRSNDAVYGCYGANVVHFSVLQEYLAARIGIPVGRYYQMSNNFHIYDWAEKAIDLESAIANAEYDRVSQYPGHLPLVTDPESFDLEVKAYCVDPLRFGRSGVDVNNQFLLHTALPMFEANVARKAKEWDSALEFADSIAAPDWRKATLEWLERRAK